MSKPTCCWVLKGGEYCGKKVKYTIVKDDDQNPQRKYEPFCPEHKVKADEQLDEGTDLYWDGGAWVV